MRMPRATMRMLRATMRMLRATMRRLKGYKEDAKRTRHFMPGATEPVESAPGNWRSLTEKYLLVGGTMRTRRVLAFMFCNSSSISYTPPTCRQWRVQWQYTG
eukprot:2949637-Pyramimonas_sp.AAC.1